MRNNKRQRGLTLTEVVVTGAVGALFIGVLFPAMAAGRAESLAARCASNLQRIGQAYALWAGDNTGFWPPRCRESAGCDTYSVSVGWISFAQTRNEDLPYAERPNDGLSIVGEPTLQTGSPGPYGALDALYNRSNNFSLNPYLIPNWRLGRRMPTTRCPADVDTLLAPNNDVAGIPQGSVASSFQLHGTSYYTNVTVSLPWQGHGAWTRPVESALNKQVGPNYNPELIYKPHRYVVSGDLGPFFWNIQALLDGVPSGQGAWHDDAPPSTDPPIPNEASGWTHGSALFGDLHVQFGDYPIPFRGITLTRIGPYVNPEWSLYPYQRRPQNIASEP